MSRNVCGIVIHGNNVQVIQVNNKKRIWTKWFYLNNLKTVNVKIGLGIRYAKRQSIVTLNEADNQINQLRKNKLNIDDWWLV